MAQMIMHGRELIRINTQKNNIEYSTNNGISWHPRYSGTHAGNFIDLIDYGSEIIACTSKGVFYSNNGGISWHPRYTGSSAGSFIQFAFDGQYLLATTSKGLYYSTNKGISWHRR